MMRRPKYLTPHLTQEYIDIMNHSKDQHGKFRDTNIYKADMAANLFVLVCVLAWIVYLLT